MTRRHLQSEGGRAKVQSLPKEDRRSKIKKIGAKFPAIKIFCVPDEGVRPLEADLFGEPPAEPPEFASRCAECGGEFHQAPRHGRPLRFCSAECRKASKNRQKREWAAAERAPTSALTCRRCGLAFQPPPRSAGRAPHWCSPRCKLASLRKPADPPKIPDLFSPAERKSE